MSALAQSLPTFGAPIGSTDAPAKDPRAFGSGAILKALGAKNVPPEADPSAGTGPSTPRAEQQAISEDAIARLRAKWKPPAIAPDTAQERRSLPAEAAFTPLAQDPGAAAEPEEPEVETFLQEDIDAAVEAALAEAQEKAKHVLDAERAAWANDIAQSLTTQFDTAIAQVHDRLSAAFADALLPILEEAATHKAVSLFDARLDRLLGRLGSVNPIAVKGPQPLIDALRRVRGSDRPGIRLVPNDDVELSATLGDMTISTTVNAFATTLREAIGHADAR